MTSHLQITRRDFLNGVAMSTAAGASLSPFELLAAAADSGVYPPALTGLRGNHPGSFEVAHAVARAGASFERPAKPTEGEYDLVVVGGGLSGLAAAFYFRQRYGQDAQILILDNHDDFGGHAKRNEFEVDGEILIGYGGSQSIDTPSSYSTAAGQLLRDVGIDTQRFYEHFDQEFFRERNMGRGIYFSADAYGQDVTVPAVTRGFFSSAPEDPQAVVARYPITDGERRALLDLLQTETDYLSELSREDKIDRLRRTSYRDFLLHTVGVPEAVYLLFRDSITGLWGVGWDALSALEALRMEMPGTAHLNVGELPDTSHGEDEPYIFHFPDGNAGVARAIVRALIPAAVPGTTMEDLVTARVDYAALDQADADVRIRLNSTAVDVRHASDGRHVDVTYVSGPSNYRVRGKHVVLAGNNNLIPHICPDLPAAQAEAMSYASKVPLVYISVAVRNWRALAELGFRSISIPRARLMQSFGMDFPVSMGGYDFAEQPDQPAILHGTYVPTLPDQGLSAREQHTAGRGMLLEKTFADYETAIIDQLQGALAPGGFDAQRDVAGITVNRWPHGYAYEYNDLSDPAGWSPTNGPHVRGRAQIGRISIANSDASAFAYVNGAFDAADRAVNEQLSVA